MKAWPGNEKVDRAEYVPLEEVFTRAYDDDRHFAAYSLPGSPRLDSAAPAEIEGGVPMVLAVFDVDGPGHTRSAEWDKEQCLRLSALTEDYPDFYGYWTKGGYRLVWQLEEPFIIDSKEASKQWKEHYIAWQAELATYGIETDPGCKDWTRLYRLPDVIRDGERTRCRPFNTAVMPPAPIPYLAAQVVPEPGEPPTADLTPSNNPALEHHLERLVDARPAAVEGEQGDAKTFATACWLLNDWDLDEEAAWALLCRWNQRCSPPWGEDELRTKFENAARYAHEEEPGSARRAWELEGVVRDALVPRPQPPALPEGLYGEDIVEFLGDEDEDLEQPYWVDGLVPEGVPMVITGRQKSRKSWVMYLMALLIARGEDWAERAVKRGRVLIIGREDSKRETRRRLWRLARGLGFDPRGLAGWLRVDVSHPLRLDRREDVEALQRTIEAAEVDVVFIDCLSRVHAQDENNSSEMGLITGVWSELVSATGCTIAVIHHSSKHGEGPVLQRMRGSGDLSAMVRFAIGVEKTDENIASIETDGNLDGGAGHFALAFSDSTQNGRPLIKVGVLTTGDLMANREAEEAAEIRAAVIEKLKFGPLSGNRICTDLKKRREAVLGVLAAMEEEGVIFRQGEKWSVRT